MAKSSKKKIKEQLPESFAGIPVSRLGILLALLAALLYFQTVTFDYTQDDAIVINENMFTTKGISGIPGLLGHDTFYGYFKDENKTRLVSGGRYRPLTPVMFAIEYEIAGLKPWFSHFINAISYGILCWMIFGFSRELLSARLSQSLSLRISVICALLFALHPIHTEVVANIKGRDEIIAALASFAGLWMVLKSTYKKNAWHYRGAAALIFFLGLLAKENVITMLGVVPLTLWWYQKNRETRWFPSLLPIIAASILFLVVRAGVTGLEKGKTPMELMNNPFLKIENSNYVPFSFAEKSATIMYTMGKYVQLLVFPYPLTHDYYPRHVDIKTWADPFVILSALLWAALMFAVFKGWKQRSWWAYGILFYILTMSITSNIVFPIGTNMSERFAFLPSYGYTLILGLMFANAYATRWKTAATILLGVIILAFGTWTLVRSRVWKDNHTLFTTDIKTSTRSAKLLNAVGGDLLTTAEKETDPEIRTELLQESQIYLKRALEIHPNYKLSYLLLGNSSFHLGNHEEAVKYYRHVLKMDPNYGEGKRNLGVALREMGKVQGEKNNNLTGAITLLEEALSYLPDDFMTYHLLGVAYGQKGDTQRAISYFLKEIELAPQNASAHFNLGIAYRQAGNEAAARESFEKARSLDPNLPQLQNK